MDFKDKREYPERMKQPTKLALYTPKEKKMIFSNKSVEKKKIAEVLSIEKLYV